MHHISNPLNLKTCYDPTCHDVMEKKFSAAVPVAYWCYGLGIVKQSWSRTIQCSSNKMRTEPATVRPVLRLEMLNSQCGRCSIYECAAQHPSHSIADSQWVQANTFSLQDTTHQKGLHYMHSTSNPANITGKTLSIWHAAGRGNKHNAARAKLHAALLPHAHISRHTANSFQHIRQTKP